MKRGNIKKDIVRGLRVTAQCREKGRYECATVKGDGPTYCHSKKKTLIESTTP